MKQDRIKIEDFGGKNLVKRAKKKAPQNIMTQVSSRLEKDLQARLPEFLDLTGVTQAKVVNECIRIGLPLLAERWKSGTKLIQKSDSSHNLTSE